jgi:RimJ/RimL family protein N-acetyltransferase
VPHPEVQLVGERVDAPHVVAVVVAPEQVAGETLAFEPFRGVLREPEFASGGPKRAADEGADVFKVSYMVGPAFRNTGYATEALEAVRDHLFAAGARALVATVFQDNETSAHVLIRAGFAYTGETDALSAARGGVAPAWRYRLDRDDRPPAA